MVTEDINLIYQGDHACLDDDSDEVTVLDRHLELHAYRSQRLYLQSLQKAREAESKSAVITWTQDKWDRSY